MPKAEIIAVGTELIIGETVNSNATWLSAELSALGIDVFYHSAIGDNPKRIQEIVALAAKRSDLIVFTGGLGPTDDDLTVKTVADFFNAPLIRDETIEAKLSAYFIARGMPMSKTNLKQADRPAEAVILDNAVGTAPGLWWQVQVDNKPLYMTFLPGVPMEMKYIWQHQVLPQLQQAFGIQQQLFTQQLKFFGIGESMLSEKLRDLMAQESPTVAPYVGEAEVRIRLGVKASNAAEAQQQLAPLEAEIKARLGEYCYGQQDDTLESVVGALLLSKQVQLNVAESCTGGLLSSRLTDVPGSSAYIGLNVVTYANSAKQQQLGVLQAVLDHHGAVSAECAEAMAHGVLKLGQGTIGVSVTGIAGPSGGCPEKPIGLAYIGIANAQGDVETHKVQLNSNYPRTKLKYWFTQYALYYLWQWLKRH